MPHCPAGRFIQGAPLLGPGSWQQRVVGAGYQQVCGEATAWGDGVVPVPSGAEGAGQLDGGVATLRLRRQAGGSLAPGHLRFRILLALKPGTCAFLLHAAHLEGAQQITIEGCYHSPLGAEDGRALESVQLSSDDGEAAAVAAVEAGAGRKPRLWYGSHSLLDEWVHARGGDTGR